MYVTHHAKTTEDEEGAASGFVDGIDGDKGGQEVHDGHYHIGY